MSFKLEKSFVKKYKEIKPKFGFNGLGELTFYRTYSRIKENGQNEDWVDCIERVVNTTYNIQKTHIQSQKLKWNIEKAQNSAQIMFDKIFNMKFMPPGRGFWAMKPDLLEKVGGACLNNCAFVSTDNIGANLEEATKPFTFLFDMSCLGVGVGFDLKGKDKITIFSPNENKQTYVISDDREGWVESVKLLLESYFKKDSPIQLFDYSLIRKAGTPIKTFGGTASGPEALIELHEAIRQVLNKNIGTGITERTIADIMNLIGVCVVSGNVRRTAEIMFGDSKEFLELKNYKINPDRGPYGWTSNNSLFAELGMDYTEAALQTSLNGEPGYEYLENAKNYGRMCEAPNFKDIKAKGGNPCLEQTLESYELCCLVETFPINHNSLEEYLETLKYAYLYAKTVTLVPTHNEDTNEVMLRNRRIGLSQSGIVQYIEKYGIHKYKELCETGYSTIQHYDNIYSNWFKIPKSIKTTSVKPSGTVSLLAGVTPGMHYPEANHYIRRIRIGVNSPLVKGLQDSGYEIEPDVKDKSSLVVSIPIQLEGVRTVNEVSMWEQVCLASFLQRYWADNQVSCTVTFQKDEGEDIKNLLNYFQYSLKGISFLPKLEKGVYEQMPYEEITKEQFKKMNSVIKPLIFNKLSEESTIERFCDGDSCII